MRYDCLCLGVIAGWEGVLGFCLRFPRRPMQRSCEVWHGVVGQKFTAVLGNIQAPSCGRKDYPKRRNHFLFVAHTSSLMKEPIIFSEALIPYFQYIWRQTQEIVPFQSIYTENYTTNNCFMWNMKNAVFGMLRRVAPVRGTCRLHHQGDKNPWIKNNVSLYSNRRTLRRNIRATQRNIPEDAILHGHHRGNLRSYTDT
jgi:hypothetical protein